MLPSTITAVSHWRQMYRSQPSIGAILSSPSHSPTADAPESVQERIGSLLASLAHTGELMTEQVALPDTSITMEVTRPIDTNQLLDQAVDDPEQNLPYWAEIWPSGIALASAIVRQPHLIAGRRVIELGCGVGITAAMANAAGARLTAIDYAPESLILTRVTTLRHTGREPESLLQANWRSPSLRQLAEQEPFAVALVADALYERRDVVPLIEAIDMLLANDGILWLAEPGREPAREFLSTLNTLGWHTESTHWAGPWPDPKDAGVTVRTHLLRRHQPSRS